MPSRIDPELLRRLERLDLAVGRIQRGELGGRRESGSRGSGTEFLEHRSYAPGDDPRRVDWNVYARLEELHVKEFTAEERLHLVLVVDTSPSMDYGRFHKLARARELAACLGFVALRRLDRVTLVGIGAREARPVSFQGHGRTFDFLDRALEIEPGDAAPSVEPVVNFVRAQGRRPEVVVLTDLLGRDSRRTLLQALGSTARHATCLHLVDPDEESPRLGGRVRLVDAETGRRLTIRVDLPTLEAYRERFAQHLAAVRAECRSSRVGYVRLSTEEPAEQAVLSTLRHGGLLR